VHLSGDRNVEGSATHEFCDGADRHTLLQKQRVPCRSRRGIRWKHRGTAPAASAREPHEWTRRRMNGGRADAASTRESHRPEGRVIDEDENRRFPHRAHDRARACLTRRPPSASRRELIATAGADAIIAKQRRERAPDVVRSPLPLRHRRGARSLTASKRQQVEERRTVLGRTSRSVEPSAQPLVECSASSSRRGGTSVERPGDGRRGATCPKCSRTR